MDYTGPALYDEILKNRYFKDPEIVLTTPLSHVERNFKANMDVKFLNGSEK